MSKRSHRKCLPSPRSLGGPRTETTFQKWSASLKRLRTADLDSLRVSNEVQMQFTLSSHDHRQPYESTASMWIIPCGK